MSMFFQTHKLKMNQQNQTGSNSGGTGAPPSQNAPQFTPPQAGGSGNQQQGAQQGQQSSQAPSNDPYANGGQGEQQQQNLGEYGADGNHAPPPAKKQDAVDLKYKIDGLEDFSDDEATQVKEFAKVNRLSKEQAQAFVSTFKTLTDKGHQGIKDFEAGQKSKDTKYKQAEAKNLVALIGGKDGQDFKANYAKLGQFIEKNLPEFKKALDGGNFFPPSSVMKELFDLQESLTKEDSLKGGGAAGGGQASGGGLFGFFGGQNKT